MNIKSVSPKFIPEDVECGVCGLDIFQGTVDDIEEGDAGELPGEVCEKVELEKEEVVIKRLRDPKLPSQKDVDVHWLMGHLPFRDWCPICVKAKGKEMDHTRDKGRERELPEYSWDYCFPGDELGWKWTVLVGRERGTKQIMATAIPEKGGMGTFSVDKCLDFVEENGDSTRPTVCRSEWIAGFASLPCLEVVPAFPNGSLHHA